MILYACSPLVMTPLILYLNIDGLSLIMTLFLKIKIVSGPIKCLIFTIRLLLTVPIALESPRLLAVLIISGFLKLTMVSSYYTELWGIIRNSTSFHQLRICFKFYDRLRINLKHDRVMRMNFFGLFFQALVLLGIILSFCTVKLRDKIPWQIYLAFPIFSWMTFAIGDVAIPIFVESATLPEEWLSRVKFVVGSWSGGEKAWGVRVAKSLQVKWVEVGLGNFKLYDVSKGTKSMVPFIIMDHTITLLLSIDF